MVVPIQYCSKGYLKMGVSEHPWRLIHAAIIPPDEGIGHHCHNNCEQIVGGAAVSPTPRRITRYMQSYNSRDSIFLILMSL